MKKKFEGKSENWVKEHMERKNRGRLLGGFLLIAAGIVLSLKFTGIVLPGWIYSGPMVVIFIGVFIFVKNGFKNPAPLLISFVGLGFLLHKIYPGLRIADFIFPSVLIIIGIFMIVKYMNLKNSRSRNNIIPTEETRLFTNEEITDADRLDEKTILGGSTTTIISKNFKGGSVTCLLGGTEINLGTADFVGTIEINCNVIMGGLEISVPLQWTVVNNIVSIMGGSDDSRPRSSVQFDEQKVLVLTGNCVMGGVEIKSV